MTDSLSTPDAATAATAKPNARRHDLDALRVFGCYLLLLFHIAIIFSPAPFYHARNAETSFVFTILGGFISLWHMPLLFLLAGWSAAVSLRRRGTGSFLRERWRKLAIPLVAGCVLLVPLIKYLELRSGQDLNRRGFSVTAEVLEDMQAVLPQIELPLMQPYDEGFLAFLPTFFTDLDRFSWSHLWFVAYLLVFTLVLLPILVRWVRIDTRTLRPSRLAIYLPILPLAAIQLVLRERYPGPYNLYSDWASVSYFVTYLLSGFAMAILPQLETVLAREWRRSLAIGLGTTGVLLLGALEWFQSSAVMLAGSAVAGWCFVVSLVGFAKERVVTSGPRLRYLAESAFSVYVLHQFVVTTLGFAVVQLPLGILAKFSLLLVLASAGTVGLYHFGVRPFRLTRFLLGMKPLPASDDASPGAGAAVRAIAQRARQGAVLAGLVAIPLASGSANAADPVGVWWVEGGAAQVEIAPCGDELCGSVIWLRHPFNEQGCDLLDEHNGDPALKNRPVVGLDVLRGLRLEGAGSQEWGGGEIYDPGSGRTYSAFVSMEGPDRMRVRGYLGFRILGRTTRWLRVGSENQCRAASPATE